MTCQERIINTFLLICRHIYLCAMKQLITVASALLFLAACQSNPTTPPEAAATPEVTKTEPPKVETVNPEYIESISVTFNGQSKLPDTPQQLRRLLGRPDSIAVAAVECGSQLDLPMDSPNPDFWYYGKTMYEVSGNQVGLVVMDVAAGKFQGKIGKLVLNQNTTLEDVRRYFPISAKQADKPFTNRLGEQGEEMGLRFRGADNSITLLFKKGRLQKVEFFMPC